MMASRTKADPAEVVAVEGEVLVVAGQADTVRVVEAEDESEQSEVQLPMVFCSCSPSVLHSTATN